MTAGVGLLSFQSTRPVKGATRLGQMLEANTAVSIHAPREGRDRRADCHA